MKIKTETTNLLHSNAVALGLSFFAKARMNILPVSGMVIRPIRANMEKYIRYSPVASNPDVKVRKRMMAKLTAPGSDDAKMASGAFRKKYRMENRSGMNLPNLGPAESLN